MARPLAIILACSSSHLTADEEFEIEDDDGSPEWEDEVEVPAWDSYSLMPILN